MPEPVAPWEGVKDAGSYGMNCPVLDEPMPTGEVMIPHRFWPSSEHCQYLNVWTDGCDPAAKKPVLFWIHGGGYSAGSAIEQVCYDGFNLAKKDGVVVVTVNHRLNAFGYLDLSDFGEKYWNSVNVGMADLVAALRWVKENIADFGGDPGNVTIFGQSGGGGKVTVLGQIPEAEDLFQKMIVMSGVIPAGEFDSQCTSRELVLEILSQLGLGEGDVEKLEKVPAPQFIWAVNGAVKALEAQGKRVGWAPQPNAYYTCDPLEGGLQRLLPAKAHHGGSVIAEFTSFGPKGDRQSLTQKEREAAVKAHFGEEGGEKILAAFRKAFPRTNPAFAPDYDTMFLPATVAYVKKKAAQASAPVYNYFFSKVFDIDGGQGRLALLRHSLLLPQRGAGACVPPGERGDAGPGHVRRLCELRQNRRPQLPRPAPVGPVPAREDGDHGLRRCVRGQGKPAGGAAAPGAAVQARACAPARSRPVGGRGGVRSAWVF